MDQLYQPDDNFSILPVNDRMVKMKTSLPGLTCFIFL